jgi:hypothetical protein
VKVPLTGNLSEISWGYSLSMRVLPRVQGYSAPS